MTLIEKVDRITPLLTNTIKQENKRLKDRINEIEKKQETYPSWYQALTLVLCILIIYLLRKNFK